MSAQLLDYLERQETLAELVALVTHAAPADAGPERRFRDPFLACELLRFGHAGVLSAFFSHHNALLDALVAPLRCHEPLDALVAEYTSRVMLKLLQSRRALALAYVRSHGLLGHIVEHLSNASLLQLVMGLLDALTEEVEVRGDAAVTSELGNARLKRVLTADAAQWLLDTHSVTLLMRGISATSSSAANCLECVERVVDLCPDTGVALLQSVCDTNHIAQQLEHPTMTVELARLLQLQLRVNAQANLGEFAALLACVHKVALRDVSMCDVFSPTFLVLGRSASRHVHPRAWLHSVGVRVLVGQCGRTRARAVARQQPERPAPCCYPGMADGPVFCLWQRQPAARAMGGAGAPRSAARGDARRAAGRRRHGTRAAVPGTTQRRLAASSMPGRSRAGAARLLHRKRRCLSL